MGVETLLMLGAGALVGGTISKATGGSFSRGALLGGLTGGAGSLIDAATGGHISGAAAARKQKLKDSYNLGLLDGSSSYSNSNSSTQKSLALLSSGYSGVLGNATTGRSSLLGN